MRKSTFMRRLLYDAQLHAGPMLEASAAGREGGKSKSPAEQRHKAQQRGIANEIPYADMLRILSILCACSLQPFSGRRCGVTLKSNNRRMLVQAAAVAAASKLVQLAWLPS